MFLHCSESPWKAKIIIQSESCQVRFWQVGRFERRLWVLHHHRLMPQSQALFDHYLNVYWFHNYQINPEWERNAQHNWYYNMLFCKMLEMTFETHQMICTKDLSIDHVNIYALQVHFHFTGQKHTHTQKNTYAVKKKKNYRHISVCI